MSGTEVDDKDGESKTKFYGIKISRKNENVNLQNNVTSFVYESETRQLSEEQNSLTISCSNTCLTRQLLRSERIKEIMTCMYEEVQRMEVTRCQNVNISQEKDK